MAAYMKTGNIVFVGELGLAIYALALIYGCRSSAPRRWGAGIRAKLTESSPAIEKKNCRAGISVLALASLALYRNQFCTLYGAIGVVFCAWYFWQMLESSRGWRMVILLALAVPVTFSVYLKTGNPVFLAEALLAALAVGFINAAGESGQSASAIDMKNSMAAALVLALVCIALYRNQLGFSMVPALPLVFCLCKACSCKYHTSYAV